MKYKNLSLKNRGFKNKWLIRAGECITLKLLKTLNKEQNKNKKMARTGFSQYEPFSFLVVGKLLFVY